MKKIVAMLLALMLALSMTSAFADGAIKIGGSGPLTGAAAIYGQAVANAAQLAVDELNARGGQQYELIFEDDTHDAEIAVNAYNKILDDGAIVLLSTVTTGPAIAVSQLAFEDRVFMLTPSASSADVTAGKDNVFQVCFTDPNQGTASAAYINEKKLGTKIAVIYNNADIYSTGIYQTFIAEAETLGMEIVSVTTFTDETTDFSVQVADAKDKGADLVFLPMYYQPASIILKQAADIEYAPIFFGVDGMDGILTMEGFDPALAEGVLLLTPFSADAPDELTQNFVAEYQKRFNEIPNQFAADAYDGIFALAKAMEIAGVTADSDMADVCDKLIAVFTSDDFSVEGLTGTMTWDANGEVNKIPTAVVISNGAYVGYDVFSAQ